MILFVWSGFPQYAARCVGAFAKASDERVEVIATRPRVPVEGMERLCGCPVHWIEATERVDLRALLGEVPRTLIVDGWGVSAFNDMRDHVRAAGGSVYCLVDNNFIFSWREVLKSIRFRLKLANRYRAYCVPGQSGVRLLRFYGVPADRIFTGMYSADGDLFRDETPILARPKRIVYVGQICERKNVRALVEAFLSVAPRFPDWSLDLYGSGPLTDELTRRIEHSKVQTVHLHPFVQPEELAAIYRQARVFALVSREEHWGVVVHEAALSGCALLVSEQVGAREDFATRLNGCTFDARRSASLRRALEEVLSRDDAWYVRAEEESVRTSANASIAKFVAGIRGMLSK